MGKRIRNKPFACVSLHGKNKMPRGFTFLEAGVDVNKSSSWSVFMVFKLEFSALMTALATDTLNLCRLITFSSRVPRMMSRCTFTTFRWPKRCALSIAYKRRKILLPMVVFIYYSISEFCYKTKKKECTQLKWSTESWCDPWHRTKNTSITLQLLKFLQHQTRIQNESIEIAIPPLFSMN